MKHHLLTSSTFTRYNRSVSAVESIVIDEPYVSKNRKIYCVIISNSVHAGYKPWKMKVESAILNQLVV